MASPVRSATFEADKPEPESPKVIATAPTDLPDEELRLKTKQEEDSEGESKDREDDIYADKVLQCSIENKDACLMCSG